MASIRRKDCGALPCEGRTDARPPPKSPRVDTETCPSKSRFGLPEEAALRWVRCSQSGESSETSAKSERNILLPRLAGGNCHISCGISRFPPKHACLPRHSLSECFQMSAFSCVRSHGEGLVHRHSRIRRVVIWRVIFQPRVRSGDPQPPLLTHFPIFVSTADVTFSDERLDAGCISGR